MKMKLYVSIKQEDFSEHTWTSKQLMEYLEGIMWSRGVSLCIHANDGTQIEVSPKCEGCGWYNNIEPIKNGKCVKCSSKITENERQV